MDDGYQVEPLRISDNSADAFYVKADSPKQLPFEFRVLEMRIESACRCL